LSVGVDKLGRLHADDRYREVRRAHNDAFGNGDRRRACWFHNGLLSGKRDLWRRTDVVDEDPEGADQHRRHDRGSKNPQHQA
jgi:hypothetical protein